MKGKTVLIGVCGSVAAYKTAGLVSRLIKSGAEVHVIMTKNAVNFINPITFESLTKTKCITDTFDRNFNFDIEHISLAQKADVCLIAPASANIIGKIANGIADDMLSTTVMACKCKCLLAPAMNTNMYENQIVQDNLKKLVNYGWEIIEPASGRLACGDVGKGKLADEAVLFEAIEKETAYEKDLAGRRVLVTCGATCEAIYPVRFITNHSTGTMGVELARAAYLRGAEVTLISGRREAEVPSYIEPIDVVNAADMFDAVKENFEKNDILIKAAAVADYTPVTVSDNKIKKKDGEMSIELKRTEDILKYIGKNKGSRFICGFSMETENMLENSKKKLEAKNADMIVANNVKIDGAGFGKYTNIVTIITKNGNKELPLLTKTETAHRILDEIVQNLDTNL